MTSQSSSPTASREPVASAGAWLKAVALALAGFGLLTMLGALPAFEAPLRLLLDLAFWPLDGRETLAARETKLAAAIAGGLTVGLGAMVWTIADRVLARDPAAARAVLVNAMLGWFATDSIGSVLAGALFNVLLNVPFLLAVVWPFWRHGVGAARGA